tara:strand:+ start:906 stop:1967 length:1062 start_codon:yes stop_codon:yes gene_type:complete
MSNQPPIEVPQGAIRLNTDSQKLEFFAQDRWYEMMTDTPNLADSGDTGVGARGLIAGGDTVKKIDFINISSAGNGQEFGEIAEVTYQQASFGSNTRSIFCGGAGPATNPNDVIEFLTFSSTGNSTDFGNLTQSRRNPSGVSNQTRGVAAGGANNNELTTYNIMDFVTIASTGNAVDFGDKTSAIMTSAPINSSTRGIFAGGAGNAPGYDEKNEIDFITIATTGNAIDFGDMSQNTAAPAGSSNSIRGLIAGGAENLIPAHSLVDDIVYVTIASAGRSVDFGNLVAEYNIGHSAGTGDSTRAVFCCGYVEPAPSAKSNVIQYVSFATGGNAVDFGDARDNERYRAAQSNAHGGL